MQNIRWFYKYLEVAHSAQSFLIYGVLAYFCSYYCFSVFQFLNRHFFYNGDSGEGIMYWYTQYTKQALGEKAGHLVLAIISAVCVSFTAYDLDAIWWGMGEHVPSLFYPNFAYFKKLILQFLQWQSGEGYKLSKALYAKSRFLLICRDKGSIISPSQL